MMFEFADVEEAVERLLRQQRGKELTYTERQALQGIWKGWQYKEMAKQFQSDPFTLKQAAYRLWDPLTVVFNTKVRKSNFRTVMENYLRQEQGLLGSNPAISVDSSVEGEKNALLDGVNAGFHDDLDGLDCNPLGFVGREAELSEAVARIQAGCRLVVITGMSGIGKTCLIGKLVERLKRQFAHSFYRRAGDMPLLVDWYAAFSGLVSSPANSTGQATDSVEMVRAIMQLLREHRCLLVFDQTELLYQPDEFAACWNTNTEYGQLLKKVIEEGHRSCVVWIGREHPNDVPDFDGRMYLCPLSGLASTDARELLQAQGELNGTEEDKRRLTEFCGGHPELLLAAANCINRLHNGAIAEFLRTPLRFTRWLHDILDEMRDRLTNLEIALLYWLVLKPSTSEESISLMTSILASSEPSDAWHLLSRRASHTWDLLTKRAILARETTDSQFWVLYPPILEVYVAQLLVDKLVGELLQDEDLECWHRYPVLMPTVPAYRQAQQQRRVLEPLAQSLKLACRNNDTLHVKAGDTLRRIRNSAAIAPSYAAGNLLTIFGYLGVSLTDCDFSGLEIRQADLRYANLRDVNCANCSFDGTVFATGLSEYPIAALCPDGSLLAIGDATGRLVLWRRVDEQLHIAKYRRLRHAVRFIEFGARNLLAVATADNAIYLWWDPMGTTAVEFRPTPTTICSLSISPDCGYLAAGLSDGRIMLWNLRSDMSPSVLRSHMAAVSQLAFSPNSQQLASCCHRNILLWDVATQSPLPTLESSRDYDFLTLGWASDKLQIGEIYRDSIYLRSTDRRQKLPDFRGMALFVAFSADARYLISSSNDRAVRVWDLSTDAVNILTGLTEAPVSLKLSDDGRLLLTNDQSRVQLWDVLNQRCLWEVKASSEERLYEGLNLQGTVGILQEERATIADLGAVCEGTNTASDVI